MSGSPARSGLLLATNVLGVGALFLPWTAQAAYGEGALIGWGYHAVAGALLVAALTAAAGSPGAERGAVHLIDAALGPMLGRAVRTFYVIGVTVGQVVVSLVAAAFLGQALEPFLGRTALEGLVGWTAAGVLAVSVALASSSLKASPLLLCGTGVVLLTAAAALAVRGRPAVPSGHPVTLHTIGAAAALQFFVVVGWESASRTAPVGARHAWRGPLCGVAAIGLLYAGALVVASHVRTVDSVAGLALPDLSFGTAGRGVAAGLGLLTAYFCVRNIRTAAQLAVGLVGGRPESPRSVVTAAVVLGAVAVAGVAMVRRGSLAATDALAVPNAMAWAVFLSVGTASLIVNRGRGRAVGIAAVAVYLPLLPFLGPAALIPMVVIVASALLSAVQSRRAPGRRDPTF